MSKKKHTGAKIVAWVLAAVVVIGALGLFAASRRRGADYTSVTAKTGDITNYYSFSGTVAAKNSQILYADKAMQIKDVDVSEGQSVKKGDVLMTSTMGEDITAPFDGTVAEVDAAVNAQQMPGSELLKVVDYSDLELDVQVDEYDLEAISVGKKATVTLNALNKNVTGTVTEVASEGVNQNGVTYFDATVSLPAESDLRVGMTAEAQVLNQSVTDVTTLPMSAVQFDSDNQSFVYIKNGRKAPLRHDVTLGINDGTTVEVKSGLTNGETVLVPPDDSSSSTGFGLGRSRTSGGSGSAGANATGGTDSAAASDGGNGQ